MYRVRPPRRVLDRLLVEYVEQNPGATGLEVGIKFNISTKSACNYLSKLQRKRLVRRGDRVRRGNNYLVSYYVGEDV